MSARAPASLRLIDALPYLVLTHTHAHRLDRRDRRRALLLYYYYCVCHTDVSFRRNDFDMSTDDGGDTFTTHTRTHKYACLPISTLYCTGRESGQAVDQNSITLVAARILKYECTHTYIIYIHTLHTGRTGN